MKPIRWPTWKSLQWRHDERDGVSNQRRLDCLLNRLFRCRSKKTSKHSITGLCEGNPPVTGGFTSQKASDAVNLSIWWRHHGGSWFSFLAPTKHTFDDFFLVSSNKLLNKQSIVGDLGRHGTHVASLQCPCESRVGCLGLHLSTRIHLNPSKD